MVLETDKIKLEFDNLLNINRMKQITENKVLVTVSRVREALNRISKSFDN